MQRKVLIENKGKICNGFLISVQLEKFFWLNYLDAKFFLHNVAFKSKQENIFPL